jgi:phospholipase/lecithinase/hemolysin
MPRVDMPILKKKLYGDAGLLSQIDQFESDLKGEKADADSLYFIFASMMDSFLCGEAINGDLVHDRQIASNCADQAILNNGTAVTHLAGLGARQFMVVNSAEVCNYPLVVQLGNLDYCAAFQSRIKSEMPGKMEVLAKQLNVKIVIFDWLAVSDRIRSDPEKYGFTEITDPCLVGTYDTNNTLCESPDEYYFWGRMQITRRVHQIMGEAMAEQLSK